MNCDRSNAACSSEWVRRVISELAEQREEAWEWRERSSDWGMDGRRCFEAVSLRGC